MSAIAFEKTHQLVDGIGCFAFDPPRRPCLCAYSKRLLREPPLVEVFLNSLETYLFLATDKKAKTTENASAPLRI